MVKNMAEEICGEEVDKSRVGRFVDRYEKIPKEPVAIYFMIEQIRHPVCGGPILHNRFTS